jgi:Zn-dependent protease
MSLDLIVISMVVLILSLSFHEAAHAWTADRLGDPTARVLGRLTLNPLAHIDWIGTVLFPLLSMTVAPVFLGWAKPVPVSLHQLRSPRRDFALVALAGPVSNLVLAAGAALLLALPVLRGGAGTIPVALLSRFVTINVLLAVFNMVPIPPLDGGNVLAGLVAEPIARLIDRVRPYGFLLIYGLMLSGVLWQIMFPVYDAIARWLLL